MQRLIFSLSILVLSVAAKAQDTLPNFSVKNVGDNRIVIGWKNNFEAVTQISIQRSFDSTKNFRTILTVPDPKLPENGYLDTKAANDHMFYRLYIQLDKGTYLFSPSLKPVLDTSRKSDAPGDAPPGATGSINKSNGNGFFGINKDSIAGPVISGTVRNRPENFVPSKYVYTFRDGYVRISLPEDEKKYTLKFFTMDDQPLFELKDVKERKFKIDKTNFYKSGWYRFEVYQDDELLEKHRFFLPKEF